MKKSTFLLLLSAMLFMGCAHSTIHTVQKGESFGSIAKKYGIAEKKLRADNPDVKKCKAGTKLTINAKAVSKQSASKKPKSNPTVASTINEGINLYKNKKWGKSKRRFNKALADSRCTKQQKRTCNQYLASIERELDKKHKRNAAIWSSVANGLEVISQSLVNAANQMNAANGETAVHNSYSNGANDNNTNSNGNSRSSSSGSSKIEKHTCNMCSGTGKYPVKAVGHSYHSTFMNSAICSICMREHCKDCHKHRKCPKCGGKGVTSL